MTDFKAYKGQFDLPFMPIFKDGLAITIQNDSYVTDVFCVEVHMKYKTGRFRVARDNGGFSFLIHKDNLLRIDPSAEIKAEGYDHYLKNIE